MKAWREHRDAWQEAARLDIVADCKALGWSRRRLNAELERVASPEAFKLRIYRALKELDKPRLLPRDSTRPYTDKPYLALTGEPEAVPADYQKIISDEANDNFRKQRLNENEKRKRHSVGARVVKLQDDARRRGVDVTATLRVIERALERGERRLDKVA